VKIRGTTRRNLGRTERPSETLDQKIKRNWQILKLKHIQSSIVNIPLLANINPKEQIMNFLAKGATPPTISFLLLGHLY
jgi:hypothetical protein